MGRAEMAPASKSVCLGLKCFISTVHTNKHWNEGELKQPSQLKTHKNTCNNPFIKGMTEIHYYQILVFQIPSCKIIPVIPPNMENKHTQKEVMNCMNCIF